jgi:hypothetical protein
MRDHRRGEYTKVDDSHLNSGETVCRPHPRSLDHSVARITAGVDGVAVPSHCRRLARTEREGMLVGGRRRMLRSVMSV